MNTNDAKTVELDYNDLVNNIDLSESIGKAYGFDGSGVLTVKNVPGFPDARKKLLPLARKFALLPDEVKEKYVHKDSFYSFGWSHGKENLQGKPDLSKGSYYANPQYDKPVDDEEIIRKFPAFVHPNIWPKEELPELEDHFKKLGAIIVEVGKLLAKQCDKYVKGKCDTYPDNMLENVLNTSLCCKARLLHYFPLEFKAVEAEAENKEMEFSSWCGWHNDHGSLTGLTSAMYLDLDGNTVSNPDASAGLYIRNRKSELIKVDIPADSIAYQIGETAQIHSGGLLQATPHAVRGSKVSSVSRETFAVFMEPNWTEAMVSPFGIDATNAQSQSAAANLPPGVPPLASRWAPFSSAEPNKAVLHEGANGIKPQTFGDFTEKTIQSYY